MGTVHSRVAQRRPLRCLLPHPPNRSNWRLRCPVHRRPMRQNPFPSAASYSITGRGLKLDRKSRYHNRVEVLARHRCKMLGVLQQNSGTLDATVFTKHLRKRAIHYFPESARGGIDVTLSDWVRRKHTILYRFVLRGNGTQRFVRVKVLLFHELSNLTEQDTARTGSVEQSRIATCVAPFTPPVFGSARTMKSRRSARLDWATVGVKMS